MLMEGLYCSLRRSGECLKLLCPIHTANADATQLSSWVASASAVCIEFATSSRRLPTKICKLNMLRIYPVELSRVELCRRCVHARRLSWPSLQFCSLYVTGAVAENWKLGHDWRLVRSHRRRDSTRQLSCVGVGGVYWALHDFCPKNARLHNKTTRSRSTRGQIFEAEAKILASRPFWPRRRRGLNIIAWNWRYVDCIAGIMSLTYCCPRRPVLWYSTF